MSKDQLVDYNPPVTPVINKGSFFHKLTPEEHELLSMLAEEASEIGLAVGKIMRHGLDSYHPDNTIENKDNRFDLAKECGDLFGVLDRLTQLNILDYQVFHESRISKMYRATPYLHHQTTDWDGP